MTRETRRALWAISVTVSVLGAIVIGAAIVLALAVQVRP